MPASNRRIKRRAAHSPSPHSEGLTGNRNLEQDVPSAGMVVAGVEAIGRFIRTSRFILATVLLQLALSVAPAGSELERYLKALLKGWSGD